LPFIFEARDNAEAMVARFAELGWRAQIVGPHGVGKSTLMAALSPVLLAVGKPAHLIALRDGQRSLPHDWQASALREGAGVIVVDGYEQLSRWNRWRLRSACRSARWGLLVTAHQDMGLPSLAQLAPKLATVQVVVDRLLGERRGAIPHERVAEQFAASGGNVRETLFALYDEYESLVRNRPSVRL
jgi:hypothetical protein